MPLDRVEQGRVDEAAPLWSILVVGLVVGGMAGFISASLLWVGLVEWYGNRSAFFEGRYEYYFSGANKRGYLDLCPDAGEPGVRFEDECVP